MKSPQLRDRATGASDAWNDDHCTVLLCLESGNAYAALTEKRCPLIPFGKLASQGREGAHVIAEVQEAKFALRIPNTLWIHE